MCTGCIVSVLVKWTASWQRWRLAGQQSTWSLWRCCWRTCRSAPRWQVTGTANGPLVVTHIGHFNSPPWCVFLSLSGIYRELCLESVKHKYDCETQAACQHWEVRNTHVFSSLRFCIFASNITFVLLWVCAEWEAVALRHGTKWTGGENKKAGGRPTQHWYHIRYAEALHHVLTSTLY